MTSDFCIFYPMEEVEESMSGVRGVLDYVGCFSEAAGGIDSVNGWEAGLCDGLGLFTILCSFLRSWAEQEPYQAVIYPERMLSMVVKIGESCSRHAEFPQLPEKNGKILE